MRTKVFGSMAAAISMICLLVLPVISAVQDTEQEASLDDLLKQRRDTLRQIVKVVSEQYLVGASSFDSVVQAKHRLIESELELAENRQQRLAILQQQLKMFETLSAATDQRFQLGQITQEQMLAARVAVLDAKIGLIREQEESGTAE